MLLMISPCINGAEEQAKENINNSVSDSTIIEDDINKPETLLSNFQYLKPWLGDYEAMIERRTIRILVSFSQTNFYLDGAMQKGISAELINLFEKMINKELKLGSQRLKVIPIPVDRDRIFTLLEQGYGDLASSNITITEKRREHVDFSTPIATDVKEIIVTSATEPKLRSIFDLSDRTVYVTEGSSYYESLVAFNSKLATRGLVPIIIVTTSQYLMTEDILELVNSGSIPITVVDDYQAKFWADIFKHLVLYEELSLRNTGEIAWAIRKETGGLKDIVDRFVNEIRRGTLQGNVLIKRYFENRTYVRNALNTENHKRFVEMSTLFKKYAKKYNFDWLLITAQAFQESELDQSKRSNAGAIGIMQVLPTTATDPRININDIEKVEQNIHAGVKYLRHLINVYFKEEGIDDFNRQLFAFAGYNAGPTRINKLRKQAENRGLDKNLWFNNVELVAAEKIGRETVDYVRNIFKYYVSYKLYP